MKCKRKVLTTVCESLTLNKCYTWEGVEGWVGDEQGTSYNRICNNLKSDQMGRFKFFDL